MIDPKRIMYEEGRRNAEALQIEAPNLTDTELCERDSDIPDFAVARLKKNMLERPIGFVCKSPTGRVVRLLQPYDSDIYSAGPESLPAQWGFVWSKNPARALPFIPIATSPYMTGECCIEAGQVYRSKIDNNVYAPSGYPRGWEKVEV